MSKHIKHLLAFLFFIIPSLSWADRDFNDLPPEMLALIGSNLSSVKDILALTSSNKQLHVLSEDIWHLAFNKRFRESDKKPPYSTWQSHYLATLVRDNVQYLKKYKKLPEYEDGKILIRAQLDNIDLSLYHVDLARANLIGANLAGANLTNANLAGAKLTGADLSDATLSKAVLNWADLSNAKLMNAQLNQAQLLNADCTNATLEGANLSKANLHGTIFKGAKINGIDLTDANITEKTDLTGAIGKIKESSQLPHNYNPIMHGVAPIGDFHL